MTFSWHARNPLTGGDAWDISSDKAVESVLEGGANHEMFMQWLSRVADFFGTMKDADGKLIPLISGLGTRISEAGSGGAATCAQAGSTRRSLH